MIDFANIDGFEWDAGNAFKSLFKHQVTLSEAEQTFSNQPFFILNDKKHSQQEIRYQLLGFTDAKKLLHLTFTLRNNKIRVISARPMSKIERETYERNITP